MEENKNIESVHFTVDAGLIQRLGYELVGRAETAVSELIKNAYDADANEVHVDFINYWITGGTIIISDDGHGMTLEQLVGGFMRISSADKIHNPVSPKFKRTKAGRKGIGRFATQRLSQKLIIISQTENSDKAIRIEIDWNKYLSDVELSSVSFPVEYVEKIRNTGTVLIIENLRDSWTLASIKRIYRYVSELFQPNYLSNKSMINKSAIKDDNSFRVVFNELNDGIRAVIVDDKIAVFDKALAVFQGHIDESHNASVHAYSSSLNIDDIINIDYNSSKPKYDQLKDVYFKVYYFIYSRVNYYKGGITNLELNAIQELSKTSSGIRLYRNGFRVLPYGEPTNDWTNLDRRSSSESGTNVPLNNKNLFGFVEITDPNGDIFEETASREGLIENEAFRQLSDFIHKSITAARRRVAEAVAIIRSEDKVDSGNITEDSEGRFQSTQEKLAALEELVEETESETTNDSFANEVIKNKKAQRRRLVESLRQELEEASMLRVLAGMGLLIGEFSHEIKQFNPAIYGHISKLLEFELTYESIIEIDGIKHNLDNLIAYTAYFNTTVSQNINRQLEAIDVLAVLDKFKNTIGNDLMKNSILFEIDPWDYGVLSTIPMHKSEWSSILFNLYTNAKKAIHRAKVDGRILVEVGFEGNNIFIKFQDNGDGIPIENRSRVFNAFFTTSTPAGFDAPKNEELVGSGLGLKIIKDIVSSYKGLIFIDKPNDIYSTCFKILIPKFK